VIDESSGAASLSVHLGQLVDAASPYDFSTATRTPLTGVGASTSTLLIANDVNHDGHDDLLLTDAASSTLVVLTAATDGSGTFPNAGAPSITLLGTAGVVASSMRAADVNADGVTDLVATAAGISAVLWVRGAATGGNWTPSLVSALDLDGEPIDAVVADIDGDGAQDLIVVEAPATLAAFHGVMESGTWTFVPAGVQTLAAPPAPGSLLTAEVTGDGLLDVALLLPEIGAISLHAAHNEAPLLSPGTLVAVGVDSVALAAGRVDSNAVPDLVVLQRDGEARVVYDRTDRWPTPGGSCLP